MTSRLPNRRIGQAESGRQRSNELLVDSLTMLVLNVGNSLWMSVLSSGIDLDKSRRSAERAPENSVRHHQPTIGGCAAARYLQSQAFVHERLRRSAAGPVVPSLNHTSWSSNLADGLSLGSSFISLQMNSRSSLEISLDEAILKGFRFSVDLVMIVSVSSLSSSARVV